MCYISYKYQPPNKWTKYQCFFKKNSFRKKIGALHREHFSKNPLFPPFSLFLTVSEVFNISNKYWLLILINQLQKYFYTKHLTLLLHSNKKVVLSIAEGFRKIDFLPHFYLISQKMRCAIFQINSDLVKVYEHINVFTQETL